MAIFPIHERLAELWTLRTRRQLDSGELADFEHCLAANAAFCRQRAELHNLSLLASMTSDMEWQHDICRRIEKLDGPPPASPRL